MSRVHGKDTTLRVEGVNISPHCNASTHARTGDVEDVSGYGDDNARNSGTIRRGTFSCSGFYDTNETTGPAAVLKGHETETLTLVRRVQGDGAGLPQEIFDAVLTNYTESAPYGTHVTWSAEFTRDGAIDDTEQS